jgi:hypothetical protein
MVVDATGWQRQRSQPSGKRRFQGWVGFDAGQHRYNEISIAAVIGGYGSITPPCALPTADFLHALPSIATATP